MYPWCHASTETTYAVGDKVRSGADSIGTVVSLDGDNGLVKILWNDADYGPITYPVEAGYLRKIMPWE